MIVQDHDHLNGEFRGAAHSNCTLSYKIPRFISIYFHNFSVNKLSNPDNVKKGSIMIFDDILTEDQNKIVKFFVTERHREISCFYLSQSYTKIPKKSAIRGNFNYLILLKQDDTNLRQFFREYICDLKKFEDFKELCMKCWKKNYGFLTIDVEKCCYTNQLHSDND